LHAVLLAGTDERRLLALRAALDGTGPALLLLDPGLPAVRLGELVTAFAPDAIVRPDGIESLGTGPGVAQDVAVVVATSGSTGIPKAAELTATSLLASATASLARLGAGTGRWLCCLPTHHISGLGVLVRSLVTGTDPVIADRVDAGLIAGTGCDYVSLVPTQLRRLLDARAPVESFDAILLGGAATPADLLEDAAAAGARVVTSYGMTETCGGCVYDGVPLDDVRIASAGGLVRISGPVLFARYRLAPELTATSLRDGWFVTSDLGEVGQDGHLRLHGRADDLINSGGEKVVPGQVEDALRGLNSVRDVAVVGTPDSDWGERVTAVIVAADGAVPPGLEQVRQELRGLLPRYALPRGLVHVEEIPLLASGKPDRMRLREIAAQYHVSDSAG
jgi:O-succinylbenzoic acid--CoA ligase